MSLRPLLAGPSSRPGHLLTFARHITIPHPELAPGPGTSTSFTIKTAKRPPSLPTVYAVIRAAEKALGTSIIAIDVRRDQDTMQIYNFITVQTLHPVAYDKSLQLSIAPPVVRSDIFGGPSLAEVSSALRDQPREPTGGEEEFAFKIEKTESSGRRKSHSQQKTLTRATPETMKALAALKELGGRWEELAQKWSHLRGADERLHYVRNLPGGKNEPGKGKQVGGLVGDRTQESDVERNQAKDERREFKHRRHEADEGRGARDDEDNPIARSRQRSEVTRETRHRQRADRVAERQEEVEAPESDWKFDIDRPAAGRETNVDIDALKLRPEPSGTAPDSETGAASLSTLTSTPRPRGFSVRRTLPTPPPESTTARSSSPAAAQIRDSAPAQPEKLSPEAAKAKKREEANAAKAKERETAETLRVMNQLRRDAQAREARRKLEAERAASAAREQLAKQEKAKAEALTAKEAKESDDAKMRGLKARRAEEQKARDQWEISNKPSEAPKTESEPKKGFLGRFWK